MGDRYIALYDFSAKEEKELSFKRGDVLRIKPTKSPSSSKWLKAELKGKIGYVPANYIEKADKNDNHEDDLASLSSSSLSVPSLSDSSSSKGNNNGSENELEVLKKKRRHARKKMEKTRRRLDDKVKDNIELLNRIEYLQKELEEYKKKRKKEKEREKDKDKEREPSSRSVQTPRTRKESSARDELQPRTPRSSAHDKPRERDTTVITRTPREREKERDISSTTNRTDGHTGLAPKTPRSGSNGYINTSTSVSIIPQK